MYKILITLIVFLAASVSGFSQEEVVSIDRVKFNKTTDDWVQMEIKLTCKGNPAPDARSDKFLENVKVKAYVVYTVDEKAGKFDFYTSEVEILIMEKSDSYNVYFYMPGLIIERDRWKTDPDYYFVEISIDGEPQPVQRNAMSTNLARGTYLATMKTRADAESDENKHILMPVYLAPGDKLGRISDLPTFVRRDVSE